MNPISNVFADTVFWIALVVRADQYHGCAQSWSQKITGRIITTEAVLLEVANALARPAWRASGIALIEYLLKRKDVSIVPQGTPLWMRGWELYTHRADKSWSLTDCISFSVMDDFKLTDALTADEHFRQAGFRALLLESP